MLKGGAQGGAVRGAAVAGGRARGGGRWRAVAGGGGRWRAGGAAAHSAAASASKPSSWALTCSIWLALAASRWRCCSSCLWQLRLALCPLCKHHQLCMDILRRTAAHSWSRTHGPGTGRSGRGAQLLHHRHVGLRRGACSFANARISLLLSRGTVVAVGGDGAGKLRCCRRSGKAMPALMQLPTLGAVC